MLDTVRIHLCIYRGWLTKNPSTCITVCCVWSIFCSWYSVCGYYM